MDARKKIVWTDSNVAFFWDSYVKNVERHAGWMSEGSGKAIIHRMERILPTGFLADRKVMCDWGCGTGNFAKGFVSRGNRVYGLDQPGVIFEIKKGSEDFIAISDSGLIRDEELDLVYALEVIEHIIESKIDETFIEWRRILKKRGYLLLSTPNDEDLERNSIICPNCETEFHTVQHVRNLSSSSISRMLEENGFEVERIWLGEFFFGTNRGFLIETLRKGWYRYRKLQEKRNKNAKQPHMMVLAKLK